MVKHKRFAPAGLLLLTVMAIFLLAAETDNTGRAGLVVAFGDGRVETVCVRFANDQINGFELLQRSGLAIEVDAQGQGAAVCRIDDQGCPAGNCFCQCRGDDCQYWSYWHQIEGQWEYSSAGAASYQVNAGEVDGWSWGPGSVTEAVEPPLVSFEEICANPTPQPGETNQSPTPLNQGNNENPVNWFSYGVFLLLIGGLATGLLIRRGRGDNQQ